MLGHMDLCRRECDQAADSERSFLPFQTPGESDREHEAEDSEERRHVVESEQCLRAEELMPDIGRKDVEKPHRRQDRAGQRLLNFDVMLDNRGILAEANAAEAVHVAAIEIFVEANA